MIRSLFMGCALAALSCAALADEGVIKVEFTSTPAPANDVEMAVGYTRSAAVLTFADGRTQTVPFAREVLWHSGDKIGGAAAGLVEDVKGRPILRSAVDKAGNVAQGPFISQGEDANSLLRDSNGKLHMITHLEYVAEAPNVEPGKPTVNTYGLLPALMQITDLKQDSKTGRLTTVKVSTLDASGVGGIWIPCNGSITPWNTHLGSEEYEPNARFYEAKALEPMNLYLGTPGKTVRQGGANPYAYGFPVEVSIGADGKAKAVKHHAMGRLALELFQIMPDHRTAYAGDDGRDTMMLMFVADQAGNLDAGTIYAAKWKQTSSENGGAADLEWIRLGHATDAQVKGLIDHRVVFSDIFESADLAQVKADPTKYVGFKQVMAYPGYDLDGGKQKVEFLKVKPGMEQAAAFLETRRYAALMGATTEFTKMEGLAVDPKGKALFTAMSYIEQGMLEGQNDPRPTDHIRLTGDAAVLDCGAVYATTLTGGLKDSSGDAIASEWVGLSTKAIVMGGKKPKEQNAYGQYDKCDTDKVANPDNLSFSSTMRTLFIGEDSGNHLNNFIWAYNVDSSALTRIFSAPAGAENTGLKIIDNANGFAYLLANVQHPGAEEDLSKKQYADIKNQFHAMVDPRGAVSVLLVLPGLNR